LERLKGSIIIPVTGNEQLRVKAGYERFKIEHIERGRDGRKRLNTFIADNYGNGIPGTGRVASHTNPPGIHLRQATDKENRRRHIFRLTDTPAIFPPATTDPAKVELEGDNRSPHQSLTKGVDNVVVHATAIEGMGVADNGGGEGRLSIRKTDHAFKEEFPAQ
jgi:hypothetical protein